MFIFIMAAEINCQGDFYRPHHHHCANMYLQSLWKNKTHVLLFHFIQSDSGVVLKNHSASVCNQ